MRHNNNVSGETDADRQKETADKREIAGSAEHRRRPHRAKIGGGVHCIAVGWREGLEWNVVGLSLNGN